MKARARQAATRPQAMPPAALAALHERALEIADRAMFDQLITNAVHQDEWFTTLGMTDKHGQLVRSLAHASESVQQAVEWLTAREYIKLSSDTSGEYIDVCRRPGEEN